MVLIDFSVNIKRKVHQLVSKLADSIGEGVLAAERLFNNVMVALISLGRTGSQIGICTGIDCNKLTLSRPVVLREVQLLRGFQLVKHLLSANVELLQVWDSTYGHSKSLIIPLFN